MGSSPNLPQLPWFPNLNPSNYQITSESSLAYNCVAWAVEITDKWWWPIFEPDEEEVYWPAASPRQLTVDAFASAFETVGFEQCAQHEIDAGFDHIVLYLRDGVPTHAARNLDNGWWTSKLGRQEDIAHELHALDGPLYGKPFVFFRRRRRESESP